MTTVTATRPVDLSDLTGIPAGPAPDRASIDDWIPASFDNYFLAVARHGANELARKAGECQATGRWTRSWHSSRHAAVISLLAGAEVSAPEEDRPWHAARLDAYAAEYGLRGWHRHSDLRGRHSIQVNLIRTREDGEVGRYYTHAADRMHGPDHFWVVDRDTGRTAYRAISAGAARQWIAERQVA